jgi:hypothetical protein
MIHIERTKLLASALTNLGVGIILAGLVGPAVLGKLNDLPHIGLWVILGVWSIAAAHELLGRLP